MEVPGSSRGPPRSEDEEDILEEDILEEEIVVQERRDGFPCDQCDFKIFVKNFLNNQTHKIKCPLCIKTMPKPLLRGHLLSRHNKGESYQCPNCLYLIKVYKLKKQQQVCPAPQQQQVCPVCGADYKKKKNLKKHLWRHFMQKSYKCKKCIYRTPIRSNFKTHKLRHLELKEVQHLLCHHCSYKSKTKGNLKRHISTHMETRDVNIKWHRCNECAYKSARRENLKRHKLRMHATTEAT